MSWSSWATLEEQYRESGEKLKKAKEKIKDRNDTCSLVDKEVIGGMIGEVNETRRIIKRKVMYELNSLSDEELSLLTGKQREIAELRQRYTYTEIAKMLGMSSKTIFTIFKQAVRKVKKAKRQRSEGIPVGLSPQQEKIYILYFKKGMECRQIAEKLGTSYGNVRKQMSKIRKVLPNV